MEANFVVITIQRLLNCQNAYQKRPATGFAFNSVGIIRLFIAEGPYQAVAKNVMMTGRILSRENFNLTGRITLITMPGQGGQPRNQ